MVLELAVLNIIDGKETQFEHNFKIARKFIEAAKGFQKLSLKKSAAQKNKYILMVTWDSIEAHKVGFRSSNNYQKWKNLLHHFYNPFPKVEYYIAV